MSEYDTTLGKHNYYGSLGHKQFELKSDLLALCANYINYRIQRSMKIKVKRPKGLNLKNIQNKQAQVNRIRRIIGLGDINPLIEISSIDYNKFGEE